MKATREERMACKMSLKKELVNKLDYLIGGWLWLSPRSHGRGFEDSATTTSRRRQPWIASGSPRNSCG